MFGLMPGRRERRAERALAPRVHSPVELLRREFASLFDRAFWPFPFEAPWEVMEAWGFEVEERPGEVVVRAEVPGFEPGEIEVELRGELLTLRAEHKEKAPREGEKEPAERRCGKLERTVTLPAEIEPEKVEARYRNGVLEVHLPKVPEATPRRIEVKV